MDKTALVTAELSTGARILEILDDADLGLNVAMWIHLSEYGDWRFALSSRRLDSVDPSKAYRLVHDALNQADFPFEHTPPLMILRMNDPLVRALRRMFEKAKNVEGMRLGGQMIGDRFVEDAIVYRIQ